jgi:hypothetical protein
MISWIGNGSGNIGPTPRITIGGVYNADECSDYTRCYGALRSFPNPGTYPYHSALFGTTGVVIVR